MRWRIQFFVSLGINIALGAAWLASVHLRSKIQNPIASEQNPTHVVKTNVVVRRQFFSWAEVESSDYSTYIANLRDIGCPEQTIRDIIIADVNTLYARKLATDIISPEQQWWRSEPDPAVVQAASERARLINEERRALLARLLGADWESRDLANLPRPSRQGVALDGPVLGGLPTETKQAVQEISVRARERLNAYLEAQRQQGKTPDPAELARLRQQTRDELTRTLTPPQVEEYLLRYSQDANNLRADLGRLKYFDATPDEFRAIFRATDSIDQQLELLAGNNDPASVAQRNALAQQRDTAIKNALGPDRYQEYQLLRDPAYRGAVATAQQAGDPEATQLLYQINLAAAQQQAAISANTNLTPGQIAMELKMLEIEQMNARLQALGQDVPSADQPSMPTNPPPPAPPMRTHPYVLGTGESAVTIATMFGVSLRDIRAANPGVRLSRLKPGDTLQVPDSLPAR